MDGPTCFARSRTRWARLSVRRGTFRLKAEATGVSSWSSSRAGSRIELEFVSGWISWLPPLGGRRRPSQRPAREMRARPGPLEVEAADSSVHVEDLADQGQSRTHARLHRRRIDLGEVDAA